MMLIYKGEIMVCKKNGICLVIKASYIKTYNDFIILEDTKGCTVAMYRLEDVESVMRG